MCEGKAQEHYHLILNTAYGDVGFVWDVHQKLLQMREILLPQESNETTKRIAQLWPESRSLKGRTIPEVVGKVEAYLKGEPIVFRLTDLCSVNLPSGFRGEVLMQTLNIPRGMINTYGGLAMKAGHPQATRAVGTVMAQNPFPLVIPCHRVVRAGGYIGQYGGGCALKRQLLEMEGVGFDRMGRVNERYFCR
jgi:methylated-DNA-[protein]-cysteine S-methyltransferase